MTTLQDRCFGLLDVDEDTAGALMSQCPITLIKLERRERYGGRGASSRHRASVEQAHGTP